MKYIQATIVLLSISYARPEYRYTNCLAELSCRILLSMLEMLAIIFRIRLHYILDYAFPVAYFEGLGKTAHLFSSTSKAKFTTRINPGLYTSTSTLKTALLSNKYI